VKPQLKQRHVYLAFSAPSPSQATDTLSLVKAVFNFVDLLESPHKFTLRPEVRSPPRFFTGHNSSNRQPANSKLPVKISTRNSSKISRKRRRKKPRTKSAPLSVALKRSGSPNSAQNSNASTWRKRRNVLRGSHRMFVSRWAKHHSH
jgi:hypothetical protein